MVARVGESSMFKWIIGFGLPVALMLCVGCSDRVGETDGVIGREATLARSAATRDQQQGLPKERPTVFPSIPPTAVRNPEVQETLRVGYLATESTLVEQDGLSAGRSDPILESQDMFSRALQKMSSDEGTSLEAADLAKHYRQALERAVGTGGAVEGLSCGLSLCMGAVRASSVEAHEAWLSRLNQDPAAARYGFIETIERVGDQYQSRFLFSTDPALRAIIVE